MKRKFISLFFDPNPAPTGGGNIEEQRAALIASIKSGVVDELNTRGYATPEAVSAKVDEKMKIFEGISFDALRTYVADKKTLEDTIATQGGLIAALREAKSTIPDRKTIATEIRSYIDANKDGWEAFKNRSSNSFGSKGGFADIELASRAITMTVGTSTGSSAFMPGVEVIPGFVDLARNRPFLEDYANTSNTSSSRIVWAEKYNPLGQADFIGEGQVKPLISFEIRTLESYAKKVADKIKVSTEMIDDIDFIAQEIENELKYQVDIAVDDALLNGAGTGIVSDTDLKGLDAYAGGYVLTTIKTDNPNNFDAIRAGVAQINSLNFNADTVFINTIDAANMDLTKDLQGHPLAMEYRKDGKLFRLNPVETNQIPVGYVLIGDMSRFKVRNYKPFSISYGWVNDDFEKNLFTVIGERRLHVFVASNDTGAFIYDTFANIKTAINSTP